MSSEAPDPHGGSIESRAALREWRLRRRRTRLRRLAVTLSVLLLVVVGLGGYAYWRLNSNIKRVDISGQLGTDRPTAAPGKAINLLLVGSDTRVGQGNGGSGDGSWEPGAHSDTNLVVHLSADRSWAVVVSIPRDSMTLAPPKCSATAPKGEWVITQWNTNYTRGGMGCLQRTVEGTTGLRISHFAVVDFGGFKEMVDALGGVPVCTKTAIKDEKAHLDLAAGRHVLNGEQALGYVRVRYTLGDGSDLGRIKRQQAFLSSVIQEATKTSLLLRPDKLYSFLYAATQSLTTDPAFDLGTMQEVASSVRHIGMSKIKFMTVPNESYAPDPNRVQWKPEAEQIWAALREDRVPGAVPTTSPSPTASTEPLTVSPSAITGVKVINASGATGLATQTAKALTALGFRGVTTGSVTTDGSGVTVGYPSGQKEAARTVAAAFPGARLVEDTALPGIVVTLHPGAKNVVDIPNRVGSTPLPSQPITAGPASTPSVSISARGADEDICS